eukprot:TRINITY_DN38338_c0_g2_i1.p1 TRINITY_DN38338_c0_g2~~TRINITY_DN38338_c0_g2_i1.p1  ORF type:complete len:1148 (-),score=315.59 TRINITY_DN38338_c0_g2_i1:75-3518(-)
MASDAALSAERQEAAAAPPRPVKRPRTWGVELAEDPIAPTSQGARATQPQTDTASAAACDDSQVSLSAHAAFLLKALKASGGGTAENASRFGMLLRRWAKEGRPYRGKVFAVDDVDAALGALGVVPIDESQGGPGSGATAATVASAATPARTPSAPSKPPRKTPSQEEAKPKPLPPPDSQGPGRTSGSSQRSIVPVATTVEAFEKVVAESPPIPAGKRAAIRSGDAWPPPRLQDAALKTAKSLGPLPPHIEEQASARLADGRAPPALASIMRALHSDIRKSQLLHDHPHPTIPAADDSRFCLQAAEQRKVACDRALLAATSPVLRKRGADEEGQLVDASTFRADIVQAAVRFLYFGASDIGQADVGLLFALAENWHFSELMMGMYKYVGTLSAVQCWQMLADPDILCPGKFNEALVHRLSMGLMAATDAIASGLKVQLPKQPKEWESKEQVEKYWQKWNEVTEQRSSRSMPGWHFARCLAEAVQSASEDAVDDFTRAWVKDEFSGDGDAGPLLMPLEAFSIAALSGASKAQAELLGGLRSLLPDGSTTRILSQLKLRPGLSDDIGNLRPWVSWAADGRRSFRQLWQCYQELRTLVPSDGEALPTVDGTTVTSLLLGNEHLSWVVETSFATAFLRSLERDEGAPALLEVLLRQGQPWPAISEALSVMARLLKGRSDGLGRLPARGVLAVLEEATQPLPTTTVRVSGPANIAGVYTAVDALASVGGSEAKRKTHRRFVRKSDLDASLSIELLRLPRGRYGSDANIAVNWPGIPLALLRDVGAEWKFQRKGADDEADLPLALSLDEAQDPVEVKQQWWTLTRKLKVFDKCGDLTLSREAVAVDELKPLVAATHAWAVRAGGPSALTKLNAQATGGMAVQRRPVVLQICAQAAALGGWPASVLAVPKGDVHGGKADIQNADEKKLEATAGAAAVSEPVAPGDAGQESQGSVLPVAAEKRSWSCAMPPAAAAAAMHHPAPSSGAPRHEAAVTVPPAITSIAREIRAAAEKPSREMPTADLGAAAALEASGDAGLLLATGMSMATTLGEPTKDVNMSEGEEDEQHEAELDALIGHGVCEDQEQAEAEKEDPEETAEIAEARQALEQAQEAARKAAVKREQLRAAYERAIEAASKAEQAEVAAVRRVQYLTRRR